MKFFDTKHKRKSIKRTTVILILLLLLMYNMGMEYSDPPIEYGIAISAGNIGESEPMNNVTTTNQSQESVVKEEESQEKIIPNRKPTENSEAPLTEDYVVDKTSDKVADIKKSEKKEEIKTKQLTDIKKEKTLEIKDNPIQKTFEKAKETKQVKQKSVQEKKKEAKPRDFNEANKALSGLLNSNQGTSKSDSQDKKGETGDSKTSGVKSTGDSKYSGKGSGGNYQLSGRKTLLKSKPKPDCEKEGVIVVEVVVNNQGKVIQARGIGIGCLQRAAESAARKTRWNADPKAPRNQKGKIIYKFSLH